MNTQEIAITGTKGKTTILSIIESVLYQQSTQLTVCTSSSTEGKYCNKKFLEYAHLDNYFSFKDISYNVLITEATSFLLKKGLYQKRNINIAIYTGIEDKEHLEIHNSFKNYLECKKTLFDNLSHNSIAVVNGDDSRYTEIIKDCKAETIITYGLKKHCDVKISPQKLTKRYMSFKIIWNNNSYSLKTVLLGEYNATNITAAFIVLFFLGMDFKRIEKSLSQFNGVKGRFQRFYLPNNRIIIIDYAHTPRSLENVIKLIKKLYARHSLVTVFGCGGEKSKEKRPLMGRIASDFSSHVYLTSDNPRGENEQKIIDEVTRGIQKENFTIEINRCFAIKKAINAHVNSIILIAGRGSEILLQAKNPTNIISEHLIKEQNIFKNACEVSDIEIILDILKDSGIPLINYPKSANQLLNYFYP